MQSPSDVLGVDPDADDAAIVRAYRQRVKEAHPDHGGSADEFQAVHAAYEQIQAGVDPEGPTEPDGVDAQPQPASARVEYLNYEVLDDHGWTLHDDALFRKAADADLDPVDHGQLRVHPHESLLEAAENEGFAWPFACRGGACANCAVAVKRGDLAQPVDHILPDEMLDRDIRLSCNGTPLADELKIVYNVKNRPDLEDLRLPPDPFEHAHADD